MLQDALILRLFAVFLLLYAVICRQGYSKRKSSIFFSFFTNYLKKMVQIACFRISDFLIEYNEPND